MPTVYVFCSLFPYKIRFSLCQNFQNIHPVQNLSPKTIYDKNSFNIQELKFRSNNCSTLHDLYWKHLQTNKVNYANSLHSLL